MTAEPAELVLAHVNLTGKDFSERKLEHVSIHDCTFVRCDFRGLDARGVCLGAGQTQSVYDSCTFDGSRLWMGPAGTAFFVNCSFRNVRIMNWECDAVNLIDCTFSGVLRNCYFRGRQPNDWRGFVRGAANEIRGNDFSQCQMVQVYFIDGVDLSLQRLPTGPDDFYLPDASAATAAIRNEMDTWPAEDRTIGERFLQTIDRATAGGQVQIFGRVADYTRGYGDVGKRIIEFWRAHM